MYLSIIFSLFTVVLCEASLARRDDAPFLGPLAPLRVSALRIAPQTASCSASPSDITLTVTNPNRITAGHAPHAEGGGYWSFEESTASCSARWQSGNASYSCEEVSSPASSGKWTFEMVPCNNTGTRAAGPLDHFDIRFMLDYNITRWGSVYYKILEGTGHFVLGEQLVEVNGSAGCSFVLANGSAPVLVPPTITACRGTC
ncbi:hypothetical protein F5X99DRAFT_399583 [Biscogniauxia marginata]|nr:hypothetical protein F5X99DRAFT_399583 [Biscogniauxia marginata]